jgi:dolichol-phosphate mannosyltransferase
VTPDVWLILPTYNEAGNLPSVVAAARDALSSASPGSHRILIVDDRSPDGTGRVADGLAAACPEVGVLHRPGKDGLGRAYVAGFGRALEGGAQFILEMDADWSHDPVDIPRLVAAARSRCDLVLGSRYVAGGRVEGWSAGRRLISRAGCTYARSLLRLPVRDLTSGFKCFRADTLRAIAYHTAHSQGYAFQVELTYRTLGVGGRVTELPIVFRERRAGSSKMSTRIAVEAVYMIPALRVARARRRWLDSR